MKDGLAGCLVRKHNQRVFTANDAICFKAFGCTFGKGAGAPGGRKRVLWAIGVAIPVYMNSRRLEKANRTTKNAPGRKKSEITIFGKRTDTLRTSMRVAFYGHITFASSKCPPHVSRRDGN